MLGDSGALEAECTRIQRRRMTVQRHVTDRCHAARGGRCRSSEKAFPLGAAWFVEVDVRVYDTRQDVQPGCVDHLVGRGNAVAWQDRFHAPVSRQEVGLAYRQLVDELAASEQQGA